MKPLIQADAMRRAWVIFRRTYNFPQGRVTDHRINLTLYKLDDVMNGNLDELVRALNQEHQAEELASQVE